MDNLIVILGPTASGKTTLAVKLAHRFHGEVISADSRQIYKGMDIGTGKDLSEYSIGNTTIDYHLINILNPSENYSVFQFKKDYQKVFKSINQEDKLPILCGGTGLYLESILLDYKMPETKPDHQLREELEKDDMNVLINKLIKIKKDAYDKEYHVSKRRLIRSIEILKDQKGIEMKELGKSILENTLIIGIDIKRPILLESIKNRLHSRLKEGMIDEVENLVTGGISYERLSYFGLEYKFIGKYLSKEIDYDQMVSMLNTAINKFSKRQMTFFRRMEKRGIKINWVSHDKTHQITELVTSFLNNS